MTEPPYGVVAARAALAAGELTAADLAERHLEALRHWEPRVHAFVGYDEDEVRRAARAADESSGNAGPLHGLPISVKDNIALRGSSMTAGSGSWSVTSRTDAECWSRLASACAVLSGRTNMHEFAYGATTVNPRGITTRNPWDSERIAGGSSGGSAVSVAVGAAIASLGTDTGGSVRIPAALTGVTGLKPTRDTVPTAGVFPLSPSCDHVGVLACTASDCAAVFDCLAPASGERPTDEPAPDDRPLDAMRIGLLAEHVRAADEEVRAAVLRGVAVLESLGATIEEVDLPDEVDAVAATNRVVAFEAAQIHRRWLSDPRHEYGEGVRARLERGRAITSKEYKTARRDRSRLAAVMLQRQEQLAAIVGPTVPIVAPTVDACLEDRSGTLQATLLRNTNVFNVTGQPAITVPCGSSGGGLPIGLQLAAAPGADAPLLRLAASFQDATTWHHAVPPRQAAS